MTWKSSKQDIVADSTYESEYIAACVASKEAMWMKNFMGDLGVVPTVQDPIEIFCDNESAVALTKDLREYVKNIDLLSLIEDEVRFTSLSDSDSIRVCLLLSLEVIFMGHDLGSTVDDVFLRMVEDLEDWNDFPWGEHMWRELYAAIRNVNSNHKQAHHKVLEINPNFVPTYSLFGFVLCFKLYTLRAPLVEYGGPFGDYLKKLSLARTLREKDREPFIQSSLKDRVKALESLCENLMILPKEIKSLKARVYKLETIINHKDSTSGKQCDLGDKYWSDQDGKPFFKYIGSTNPSANKDAFYDLVDALDDLVDEDLKRPSKCIDKIYCNYYLEQFLITSGWSRCKFPWCTEIVVGRHFWDSLIRLDDERLGWLVDDGGVFGECGVFVCLFLYRLAHGIPLDVEDPIQTALAYREKMVQFFFEHKIIYPS
ncbi:hypothetical protein Tco_0983281 [Tanacetum coccineum]